RDPAQARDAQRDRAPRAPAPPTDRPPDAREPRRRARRRLGAPPPAAVGRGRLPRPAARRRDPARRADHLRRRRLRRDDIRARLPRVTLARRGARRARALLGLAVRSRDRRRLLGGAGRPYTRGRIGLVSCAPTDERPRPPRGGARALRRLPSAFPPV